MGELDTVIDFWQEFIAHNRPFLGTSMLFFIENTIKHLKNLQERIKDEQMH